ncbi:MAG: M23 family metallopeptidase [Anaerolineales bacterium]|nr:MAG: M23 family metallopeptidase [Anaerolineales bacterium]
MQRRSRRFILVLIVGLMLLAASSQLPSGFPAPAQASSPPPDEPLVQGERPFRLPYAEPPGPNTWLPAQPYGNTTGAYYRRHTLYGASGGIHFGVDLSAPCGTQLVAIADGVVFAVDGPFGSAPHNLMIDHPELGYASMYGHLLEAPDLRPGQTVKQGEVVALVGDSAERCYRRPHVHLEIRDLKHVRKYNPAALIEADWDGMSLFGSSGRGFMRDLAEPRKWQSLYDQPEARTGGPIINDFENTWPFDWTQREDTQTVTRASLVETSPSQAQIPIATSLRSTPIAQQVTSGDCCTNPYWDQTSTQVRFVDQPVLDEPLGIWGVDLAADGLAPELVTQRLGIYSPDGRLMAYPDRDKGVAVVERLEDGRLWEFDTQEHGIGFTPDSQGVIWTAYDEDAPSDSREETLWLADLEGGNAQAVFSGQRTDPIAWLSDHELLMEQGFAGTSDIRLFKYSLEDGSQTELMEGPRMRGLAFSPNRRYLVYYVGLEAEAEKNGLWLLDLGVPQPTPRKLPFFGTYRWRNNYRLIYVPFEPGAASHDFYEYHVLTKQTRPLFPEGTNLTIANNDWDISPDGRKIALVAVKDRALDGIWVVDIVQSASKASNNLITGRLQ